jgi:eukaryotic-like serine/threonine-protein kinase
MSDKIAETSQRQERLQEILLSYVEATEAGAAPDRRAFLAAHPEFADDIAEFLTSYHQVKSMVTPLRDGDARLGGLEAIQTVWRANGPEMQIRSTSAPGVSGDNATTAELGQLGDYRLLREIGRGGMGVVYEAEQLSLRRRVALKILPFAGGVDSRQLQRFRNEAEAAAHLHHSHIVPVFAVGSERGVHFYAMQYIEGQSLASLIADLAAAPKTEGGRRETPEKAKSGHGLAETVRALSTAHSKRSHQFFQTVATIGKHTAEALEYAHQMGVVHRDVKPANLLLDARGHTWITDFGLAQFQSQVGLTMTGEVLGTLRYVSPEQAMGKRGLVDHRTDIYSLGATLYELLTLHPVFDGNDRPTLLHQIGFEEPLPPRTIDPSIPVELETIVLKALATNPAERYGSAQELADDLQRFLDDQPIRAKRPGLVDRLRKWRRRHPSVVVAAVLLLVLGLVGFAVSTVLIAREQWRTKTAFDKLALEEQRTKTAYADLAAEQANTKAAYEAEARQRDLAERDFAQARRAVELVVQFSEGELAHHPGQEDVRRRLLLTVLDYYEDFLTEHADDPATQAELGASRERVALILTELSSLRGTTLVAIIQDANVQKTLELRPDQEKQVAQFVSNQSRQMKESAEPFKDLGRPRLNPKDKGPKAIESAAAVEKALRNTLSTAQRQRFEQIVLQVQQQGRYGFSDPKIVETLNLTSQQREKIRKIQTEAHQAWADHLFTDKKISKPAAFWTDVQDRITMVLEPVQREKWLQMAGPPITVDLREGYPWDGRNVNVPKPGPCFAFPNTSAGAIAVMQGHPDFTGSGFGHKVRFDDKQYYCWRGKEIPPTAFEITVTVDPLTEEERRHLVTKDDPPTAARVANAPQGWVVLFRSQDPSVWNTDSPDETRFAVPVARAASTIRYLRLKRLDTGDMLILPMTQTNLAQAPKMMGGQNYAWNGSANEAFGGRHLGIVEGRPLRGPAPKGPEGKDSPRKRLRPRGQ